VKIPRVSIPTEKTLSLTGEPRLTGLSVLEKDALTRIHLPRSTPSVESGDDAAAAQQ